MRRADFAYDLPEDLIAQRPSIERSGSRLLHLEHTTARLHDRRFTDLTTLLRAGDLLVFNDTRVIPVDGRPHVSPTIRQYLGDSRGRWDGDTFVVETANFHATGSPMGGYFRYSDENLRLTERFTRVDDDTLRYEFTVDDPTVWTEPWTAAIYWKKSAGEIYEYACHEGNRMPRDYISASRAQRANIAAGTVQPDAVDDRSRYAQVFDRDPAVAPLPDPAAPRPAAGGSR